MTKRIFSALLAVVLAVGACGCAETSPAIEGISQSEYNNLEKKYNDLQEEYDKLNDYFDEAISQLAQANLRVTELELKIKGYESTTTSTAPTESNLQETQVAENSVTFGQCQISLVPNAELKIDTLNHESAKHNGETVVGIPVLVKNISDETGNLDEYKLTIYGSKGIELDKVYYYFDDGDRAFTSLRPGAEIDGYIYALYDGDGDYYITFDKWSSPVEICVPISIE